VAALVADQWFLFPAAVLIAIGIMLTRG